MLFDFPTVSRPMSRPILKNPSVSKESSANLGFEAKVFLYGQELNPLTWAIARSNLLNLKPEGKDFDAVTTREHMQNNPHVRQSLGQRGLKPETLPPLLTSSLPRFTFQRGQLFSSTQIPVCLGFLAEKNAHDAATIPLFSTGMTELSLVA